MILNGCFEARYENAHETDVPLPKNLTIQSLSRICRERAILHFEDEKNIRKNEREEETR